MRMINLLFVSCLSIIAFLGLGVVDVNAETGKQKTFFMVPHS